MLKRCDLHLKRDLFSQLECTSSIWEQCKAGKFWISWILDLLKLMISFDDKSVFYMIVWKHGYLIGLPEQGMLQEAGTKQIYPSGQVTRAMINPYVTWRISGESASSKSGNIQPNGQQKGLHSWAIITRRYTKLILLPETLYFHQSARLLHYVIGSRRECGSM